MYVLDKDQTRLAPPEGKKVSEYDQEIPQSHTADQPTAPCGRAGNAPTRMMIGPMHGKSNDMTRPFNEDID